MNVAAPPPAAPVAPRTSPPTFSVLIAAYQVADCVAEAVASALGQTEPPHEVVVCDDGSTDDLGAALSPFTDRILLVRQDHGGEAAAKNAAARAASGDFVAILDADDVYLPERLAALGRLAAERPDLDILTTDAYLEAAGRVVRRVYTDAWPFAVDDQRRAILERNFIFGHAAVRREVLLDAGGFDESIRRTTDWECWIRLVLDGAAAGAVLEPLARYRVREAGLSADRAGMLKGGLHSLDRALRHPRLRPGERAIVVRTMGRMERQLAVIRLREALRGGSPDVRRRAAAVAFGRSVGLSTRLKAAAATVAPRAVGRRLRSREADTWVGAGGTTVDRA